MGERSKTSGPCLGDRGAGDSLLQLPSCSPQVRAEPQDAGGLPHRQDPPGPPRGHQEQGGGELGAVGGTAPAGLTAAPPAAGGTPGPAKPGSMLFFPKQVPDYPPNPHGLSQGHPSTGLGFGVLPLCHTEAQPRSLPAARQQQPGPAGVVPSVQPEVLRPRHSRQPPPGLRRALASPPGPRGEPGRRERQHGPALQRLPLQLPHRAAAAGHGWVTSGLPQLQKCPPARMPPPSFSSPPGAAP